MLKPIKGYDGYFIDDQGNVYSLWVNKGMHGLVKGSALKKLKGSPSKHGYTSFRFTRGGKAHALHRLMIETFVGPIAPGMVVCHKNDDPKDNRISNLYVGSQKQNMRDSIKLGNFPSGSKNGHAKLTDEDVKTIREMKKKSPETPNRVLAETYGVTRRSIDRLMRRESYKNVV